VPDEYRASSGRGTFFAYGGWWEDRVGVRHDGNFNQNGLVSADRKPHPGLRAIKHVHQPLQVVNVSQPTPDTAVIRIRNRHDFLNAKDVATAEWRLVAGSPSASPSGRLPELDIPPGGEREYPVDVRGAGTRYLNVTFRLATATPWAPQGHEAGWFQTALEGRTVLEWAPPLRLTQQGGGNVIRFSGDDFALVFDGINGTIASYTWRGVTLVERGPIPEFWRAMTDNDIGAWKSILRDARRDATRDVSRWREAGPGWRVTSVETTRTGDATARVSVTAELPGVGASYVMTYDIWGSGLVFVTGRYTPGAAPVPMMPRFGTELVLAPGLEHVRWWGRGPDETYADRAFEPIGWHESTVDGLWVEYSRPQENGNRTEVSLAQFRNARGEGLGISGGDGNGPPIAFRASHVSTRDLEAADYSFQLPRRREIYLNIDAKQMGVGGINSWTTLAWPLEKHRISGSEPHEIRFVIHPLAPPR
jgi:beta-galactosidase